MDKVFVEVKKVEEWLNQCHCTLLLDGDNSSSLLSILSKVGFYFRVCCFSFFYLKNNLTNLSSPFREEDHWIMFACCMLRIA